MEQAEFGAPSLLVYLAAAGFEWEERILSVVDRCVGGCLAARIRLEGKFLCTRHGSSLEVYFACESLEAVQPRFG